LISGIANDSAHYQELVDRVKPAAQNFDPNRMVEDYERVYFSLIEQEDREVTTTSSPT
jgi:hypothetical protein